MVGEWGRGSGKGIGGEEGGEISVEMRCKINKNNSLINKRSCLPGGCPLSMNMHICKRMQNPVRLADSGIKEFPSGHWSRRDS